MIKWVYARTEVGKCVLELVYELDEVAVHVVVQMEQMVVVECF